MSITQAQQTEKAYKKAGLNVAMTGSGGLPFFTEPASPTVVFANNIVGRPDLIPVNAPTTSLTNGTKFNSAGAVTTGSDAVIQYNETTMAAYAGSSNVSYKISSITGIIIPFNYGNGSYSPQIYANTIAGVNLPFGLNSWELDTAAGVVTFFDGKPASITANTIGIKYWTYVGANIPSTNSGLTSVSYDLSDIYTPPANTTCNTSTYLWTINHNLNSTAITATLIIDGSDCSDMLVRTSTNVMTVSVLGYKNKSTNVVTYPTSVVLTIFN
jgi:hypothetical protein